MVPRFVLLNIYVFFLFYFPKGLGSSIKRSGLCIGSPFCKPSVSHLWNNCCLYFLPCDTPFFHCLSNVFSMGEWRRVGPEPEGAALEQGAADLQGREPDPSLTWSDLLLLIQVPSASLKKQPAPAATCCPLPGVRRPRGSHNRRSWRVWEESWAQYRRSHWCRKKQLSSSGCFLCHSCSGWCAQAGVRGLPSLLPSSVTSTHPLLRHTDTWYYS